MHKPRAKPKLSAVTLLSRNSAVLLAAAVCSLSSARGEDFVFFEKWVRPLLVEHCYECHSGTSKKVEGRLRVDSRDGLLRGGFSGAAIIPFKADSSLLIKAVRYTDPELKMPPHDKRLMASQIAMLVEWVSMGAPDPRTNGVPASAVAAVDITRFKDFWSFRPLRRPSSPVVRQTTWPQNEVDLWILAKLEENGLSPSIRTDRRTLIRRATFDLTGLPPTPEAVRLFLEDTSADAFSKVVDRLLASYAYGEHWGRHWLDVVRYADTAGETADFPVREAYKYRNYVISALNGDKPYDQFVREQVAGDILVVGDDLPAYLEKVTATGFLAISRRFGFDIQNYHHLTIQDTLDTLGQAFLGLTLGCARCHDHKFDPISARDYYALYGILESTQYAFPGSEEIKRPRSFNPALPSADAKVIKEAFDAEMLQLNRQIKEAEEAKKKLEADLAALNKQVALLETKIPASTNDALSTPPATPSLVTSSPSKNAALPDAGRPGQTSPGTPPGLDPTVASRGPSRADDPSPQQRIAAIRSRLDEIGTSNRILLARRTKGEEKGPYPVLYGVTEGTGRNSHIHIRGEPKSLGDEVPRGFLEILGGQRLAKGEFGSGRRQLAEWLVSPENPLTARVMVNRIWQHHFGSGLVPSENNFGARGQPPSHPELLDGLALRFMEGGWSIKALHRLILLSATYQQSSQVPLASPTIDPENRLLSRFPRRRLQAEAVRDSMLDLGGNLDRTVGGPHPFPPIAEWNFTQHAPFYAVYESTQRSVYLMTQRIRRHPFLALFDAADVNTSTAKRDNTTVPTQALFFMNSSFVHTQAAGLSKRLLAVSGPNSQRIARGFEMAYARLPRDGEINESLEFLEAYRLRLIQAALPETERESQAWAAWARTLLSRNEFVYID